MLHYGQFCPVAKAAEILGERWMLLVVRELVCGSRRYAELQRGLGRISPSVLSQRLKTLVEAGVVERVSEPGGHCYQLTAAGRELEQVVLALGTWGQRWNRSRLSRDELDVELLMLELARNFDTEAFPLDSAVVGVRLTDQRGQAGHWWLLVDGDEVELCTQHPGRAVDVTLTSTLRTLVQVWRGDVAASDIWRAGSLTVDGPKAVARCIDQWLGVSLLAHVGPA